MEDFYWKRYQAIYQERLLAAYPELFIPPALLTPPLELQRLFPAANPVCIEIGSGNGQFLAETASKNPGQNFIGVEKSLKYLLKSCKKLARLHLPNVKLIYLVAEYFLARFMPDRAVNTYYIFFPDPWPKTRHHKHRLFTADFLGEMDRTLGPSGEIHIATDVKDYFDRIGQLIRQTVKERWTETYRHNTPLFRTNYEFKQSQKGYVIYSIGYRRG